MDSVDLLVIGGSGFVGRALERLAPLPSIAGTYFRTPPAGGTTGLRHFALDVTDAVAVRDLVARLAPRVIVNAAVASRRDDPPETTTLGAAHLAAAARANGARFLHLSSDMVFSGNDGPYDEDARPAPILPYGAAKAEAEARVRAADPDAVVARLPLLYSATPPDPAFARFLELGRTGRAYPLFVDELRCPAQVDDVAASIGLLARALAGDRSLPAPPPVVHLPGPRVISRHALGRLLLGFLGLPLAWAIPGRSDDADSPRPRELVLLTPRTPAAYLAPLRPPEVALATASEFSRPTSPSAPRPRADR